VKDEKVVPVFQCWRGGLGRGNRRNRERMS